MENSLKFIDLFCGIGGFHAALDRCGFECVFASDIDKDCRKTYETNWNLKPDGDITEVKPEDIPKFDILCAGFPCQPFSKSGDQSGFKHKKGNLFENGVCRILEYHQPKYIILENVKNLKGHDKGNTWKVIRKRLRELNYSIYDDPLVLNAQYFSVPQCRQRVIIIGVRKDLGKLPEEPKPNRSWIKETSLYSIMRESEKEERKKYAIKGKLKKTEEAWNEFLLIMKNNNITTPKFPIWTDWWDSDGEGTSVTKIEKKWKEEKWSKLQIEKEIKKKQKAFYKKYTGWIDKNRTFYKKYKMVLDPWLKKWRKEPLWKGAVRKMEWQAGDEHLLMNQVLWSTRGSGVRIKRINYAPTLVAMTSMVPIFGPESRHLTPKECVRLQSFPDNFVVNEKDNEAYKQAGNAVNVDMIEKAARFLIFGESLIN